MSCTRWSSRLPNDEDGSLVVVKEALRLCVGHLFGESREIIHRSFFLQEVLVAFLLVIMIWCCLRMREVCGGLVSSSNPRSYNGGHGNCACHLILIA
jgi:hypothetical protein